MMATIVERLRDWEVYLGVGYQGLVWKFAFWIRDY
jgi:hypothetical protein